MPPTEFDVAVGERIRERRKALGLTLNDVAKSLSVSQQQYFKLEQGTNRLRAEQVVILSDCLELSVGELLGRPGPEGAIAEVGRLFTELPTAVSDALISVARFVAPRPRRPRT